MDLAADMIRFSGLEPGRDIDIEITGMRPGEKLYEELHTDDERHRPTAHPKIVVAAGVPADVRALRESLNEMADLTERPGELMVDRIAQLVPEYRSAPPSQRVDAAAA